MQHRSAYRTTDVPNHPGVYIFRDRMSTVIYVGKARSLRRRLSSYFQPSRQRTADPKLRSLIHSIEHFEYTVVRTEQEALLLESRLIKQYTPRFNILLRDDKRFLLIKLDLREPYPRLRLARVRKDDGCRYFGPYPVAGALRDTIDYLSRRFGLRTCSPREPGEEDYRHCHNDVVRFCSAPCVAKVTPDQYMERVQQLITVVEGSTTELVEEARQRMQQLAADQKFELAAKMRDVIENLKTVFGEQHRTFQRLSGVATYPGEAGVRELQQELNLSAPPRVIECFDNSNLMGQMAVSSMVRFVDGTPSRKDYRHYKVRTVEGIDDFASMAEIVQRRYRRLLDEDAPMPDLILIDGGLGQLHAAHESLEPLGLAGVPMVGLAKREEEIYTLSGGDPIRLDRHQLSLRLLQAIRDEAHRFAITFHKDLRRRRLLNSLLDEIPGVGKVRKQQILQAFGSVRNLRRFTAAELSERVAGIGDKLAAQIMAHIQRGPKPEA